MDLQLNVRNDRVLRLLKAFITVDEFSPLDLVVRRGPYYHGDRPARGSLEVCRTHWRYALKDNPLRPTRHRSCSLGTSGGGCVLVSIRTEEAEKDRVEITHRGTLLRGFYIMPSALRDAEDRKLYTLLRDRGATPDEARNSVLGLGLEGIDRLIAQIEAGNLDQTG
jgi:hypothetical protein